MLNNLIITLTKRQVQNSLFVMSVRKNKSKCQNTALFRSTFKFGFKKKDTFKPGCSLGNLNRLLLESRICKNKLTFPQVADLHLTEQE